MLMSTSTVLRTHSSLKFGCGKSQYEHEADRGGVEGHQQELRQPPTSIESSSDGAEPVCGRFRAGTGRVRLPP